MAQPRASARTPGKSDPIDGLAVARAYLWEPGLPVASHDEVSRELKLLVRREDLVAQRTATINRLLWRVHELDPEIDALAKRIGERVREVAPVLLALAGCGELTAAKLLGEVAGITRFKSEAAFARQAGVAPIPVWSGNTAGRVRMTQSGNRQLNAALHRIAVTQIRLDGLRQADYRHPLAAGDSSAEALRCLKRRLARVVFNHLHTDQADRQQPRQPAAA